MTKATPAQIETIQELALKVGCQTKHLRALRHWNIPSADADFATARIREAAGGNPQSELNSQLGQLGCTRYLIDYLNGFQESPNGSDSGGSAR